MRHLDSASRASGCSCLLPLFEWVSPTAAYIGLARVTVRGLGRRTLRATCTNTHHALLQATNNCPPSEARHPYNEQNSYCARKLMREREREWVNTERVSTIPLPFRYSRKQQKDMQRQRQRQRQRCTETATANGNGETATAERQRNGGNQALVVVVSVSFCRLRL